MAQDTYSPNQTVREDWPRHMADENWTHFHNA